MSEEIPLKNWGSWFFENFEKDPKVIYDRVIRSSLDIQKPSMGQSWKPFKELFEALGPFEFEVYLNCVLDAKKPLIEDRGFYPSILLGEESVEAYEERREALIGQWAHPARRYRDPLFNAIFASETNLASEIVAQVSRTGEFVWEGCVTNILTTLHPYWVLSTWSWKDFKELAAVLPEDFVRDVRKAQAVKVKDSLSKRLNTERMRASFECSVTVARRVLQKKNPPETFTIPVQTQISFDWSPLKSVMEALQKRVPRNTEPFSFQEDVGN